MRTQFRKHVDTIPGELGILFEISYTSYTFGLAPLDDEQIDNDQGAVPTGTQPENQSNEQAEQYIVAKPNLPFGRNATFHCLTYMYRFG